MRAPEFFQRLHAHPPQAPAIVGDGCEGSPTAVSYGELLQRVEALKGRLLRDEVRVLCTRLDNGLDWIVADLAALAGGIVHVPVPHFFSDAQRQHVLAAAGADGPVLLRIDPAAAAARATGNRSLSPGIAKITFTSGSTGTPKGVCLDAATMLAVAEGVASATAALPIRRHLCALPLPILLENIAGLLAPLLRGAAVVAPPLAAVGLSGSSTFDPARLDTVLRRTGAMSVILLPQMLRAWAAWLQATAAAAPAGLLLAAVGGAFVGPTTIAAARAVGIPAYEGYGLSEGASVQTMNLPGADRPGSAGRPLPHARLRVAADGELEIGGTLFQGYLGAPTGLLPEPSQAPTATGKRWWRTGDLGSIDADGFVHVRGRKDALLVTAYGRNVSPEWVETTLQAAGAIAQAAVLGAGQPALGAVLWPLHEATTDDELAAAVARANHGLPDYARIGRWARAGHRFDAASGMATANGRPRREAIAAAYAQQLFDTRSNHMPFFSRLLEATSHEREKLVAAPIIQGCLAGQVTLPSYVAFLEQAYHHVRHTVPLLRSCRARLPPRLAWMRPDLDEYIAEEEGHDQWILQDLRACGVAADQAAAGRPGFDTEVMVAYAYDTIERVNPLGFFGMVHVLEGTSVALALQAAEQIQRCLRLPDNAFSYLRSHGILDRQHTAHFAALMDRIADPRDQADIIHAATMFYRLYGNVFRSLPLPQLQAAGAAA